MDGAEAVRLGRELQDRILSTPISERSRITYSSVAWNIYAALGMEGQYRVYLAVHHANKNPASGKLIGEWNAWPNRPGMSPSFPLYRTRFAGVGIEYVGAVRPGGGIRVETIRIVEDGK